MRWRLRRFFYTLLVLAVILLVAFLMLRSRYREIVTELAETQVKNATSDLTNDAIAKQIANGTIQYDRIVYFEKNLDGRITALKTNMSEINHLKTDILNFSPGHRGHRHTAGEPVSAGVFLRERPGNPGTHPVHPKQRRHV